MKSNERLYFIEKILLSIYFDVSVWWTFSIFIGCTTFESFIEFQNFMQCLISKSRNLAMIFGLFVIGYFYFVKLKGFDNALPVKINYLEKMSSLKTDASMKIGA